jgi:hypothetical protein
MAKAQVQSDEGPYEEVVADVTKEWEWDNVVEEAGVRVIFNEDGDTFIGMYIGTEHIIPDNGGEEFDLLNFRGVDDVLYSINTAYKLENAMKQVQRGQWVRIQRVKEIPTKRGLQPMIDFRVDVRK